MKITIDLSTRTVMLIRSPLFYVVGALTGISMSFCLFWIYQCGQQGTGFFDARVILTMVAIWLVHGFYQMVASPVIRQVRQAPRFLGTVQQAAA